MIKGLSPIRSTCPPLSVLRSLRALYGPLPRRAPQLKLLPGTTRKVRCHLYEDADEIARASRRRRRRIA